jgi:lysophospholipase L1-like esterase
MLNKLHPIFLILFLAIAFFLGDLYYNKLELALERVSPGAIVLRKITSPSSNVLGVQSTPRDLHQIVMLGDSMTERLGNSTELQQYLKTYYPDKRFLILNYGYGSTNILSASERLEKETFHAGRAFQPILNIDFDTILIESFGNNPLSDYPLNQGLQIQNQALDKIVSQIKTSHPQARIVFVSTIAPNKANFAKSSVDLSPEKRAQWVAERDAYMENHINYAKAHRIPFIDIYSKSKTLSGDGDMEYIDSQDYIHPSPKGIYFISEEIATFFYQNKYF